MQSGIYKIIYISRIVQNKVIANRVTDIKSYRDSATMTQEGMGKDRINS